MTHPIVPDDITKAVLRSRQRQPGDTRLECPECGRAQLRTRGRLTEHDYYCDPCGAQLQNWEVHR